MKNNELTQNKPKNVQNNFWQVKENGRISIQITELLEHLKRLGVFRFDLKEGFAFVRIEGNIVEYVNIVKIQDVFFDSFTRARFEDNRTTQKKVLEALYSQIDKLFTNNILARLRNETPPEFIKDTKTQAFLFFKNTCVEVTADKVTCKPYELLQGYVWKNNLINRDFEYLFKDFSQVEQIKSNDFAHFVWLVAGQDTERFLQLCCIIGYALHTYEFVKRKAICFTDSSLSEGINNGRTGKTLLAKALGKIRAYTEIAGKDFRPDNKHKYQTCSLDTQIVCLNDLKSPFNFEYLYNDITEGISVEKKNQTPFTIQPKIIITTNQPIITKGASDTDRIIEFEFSDYFSPEQTPQMVFGKYFFEEWDKKEWNDFDNFIIWSLRVYLKNGLVEPTNTNLETRKFIKQTSRDFYEWTLTKKEEFYRLATDPSPDGQPAYLYRDKLKAEFEEFAELDDREKPSSKKFKIWLDTFFKYAKIRAEEAREKGKRGRFCLLPF